MRRHHSSNAKNLMCEDRGSESCGCKRDGGTEIGDGLDGGEGDGGGGKQIEKTAKKLRKESKATKQILEALTSAEQLEILSGLSALFAESNPISESTAEEKTLREHAAPQVNQAPLCIATPTLQAPLELKSGLIHLLPKFRGLMNEDPYQHLKVFHVDSVTSWEGIMRLFLDRYFPSSRVINGRRDICGIKQKVTETLIGNDSRSFVQVVHSMTTLNNLSFITFTPQAPSSSQQPSSSRSDSSLEDIVKSLALNTQQFQMSTQQFQNETRSSIQSLESQCHYFEKWEKIEEPVKKRSRGHGSGDKIEPEVKVAEQKAVEPARESEKTIIQNKMLVPLL
ncbi:DNA-directed DNA polymerase [Senna tora]|uniref:DNA-directed DNA polymerase n=1 Tax=Senna tora TaxID=362788 RepID=A0A834SFZ4_9FABA|nr:DNA-directed DNA polymerase [Senna tora]